MFLLFKMGNDEMCDSKILTNGQMPPLIINTLAICRLLAIIDR